MTIEEPLPAPSNPVGMDGIEFIEYATAQPQALGTVLARMGFMPVAHHRSREVTLYRQGGMNLVVNSHHAREATPQISAIAWVSELIGIAGGDDVFPERARASLGSDRIIADPMEVVARAPDIVIGSWCGKKFRPERVAARSGWIAMPAVRDGELHEVKSPIILQPGPAALTAGLDALHRIIAAWALKSEASGR